MVALKLNWYIKRNSGNKYTSMMTGKNWLC